MSHAYTMSHIHNGCCTHPIQVETRPGGALDPTPEHLVDLEVPSTRPGDIMESTGPGIFTDAVMEHVEATDDVLVGHKDHLGGWSLMDPNGP